ncbi:MAG: type II toxin-antitoxin system Phd/YefM family antitoxin [Streptomyces sp.]|uniref:type II toxin-antitoxin system Phd/YefM family antitoxin n=1 Tax=Streptomyces sp. TaxID=1931 RepID=UPI003D6BCE35
METTAREFNQNSSRILAAAEAGEIITVTKNGRPVAIVRPYEESDVPPYPVGPMGDIDIPALDLPDLSNDEIEETLRGMGS